MAGDFKWAFGTIQGPMASLRRDEDVADNSRLGLCNGSVILSGNSPQGSITRSSIGSIGPTNASVILAGIFDDYHNSVTIDTLKESNDNSLMNRNITLEEKKVANMGTSPVTIQRKTRTVTPIKEIIKDYLYEFCGSENERHNNDTEDLRSFDFDNIMNESERRIITDIKTDLPDCSLHLDYSRENSDGKHATRIENLTNNFLTLSDVEDNGGSKNMTELHEAQAAQAAELQNGSKVEDETNFKRTILMEDIVAPIEYENNAATATGKTDSKFSDVSTVLNDFSNKTSNYTDPRNSRDQVSDWNNNEDSGRKYPRLPRYKTRSPRSPMRELLESATSQKVYTVSELIDKYSKLSAANKMPNSPRFRRPPKNARRSLFNISTRGTVLTGRKRFRVHRSPNKCLHSSKGSDATSTLQGGKQINQQTMKPVGCSYIGRTPSKSMQALDVNNQTSTNLIKMNSLTGEYAASPAERVQAKKSSPSTSDKSLLKFSKQGLVTADYDSAKRPVDKDNNYTVRQLINKFSNFSSETKSNNCMSLRRTVRDVEKSSKSSMRGTPLRQTPKSPANWSTKKSPLPTEASSSISNSRRADAQIKPQTMKHHKYSHIVERPSKSMRSLGVDKTKVAPSLREIRDIRANKGFNIPKILIHSPSRLSSLELDSAPFSEEAIVLQEKSNNSPQYKDENVNRKRSLTPEYSGLQAKYVRKKKLDSVPTSETSLFKIHKTGLVKRDHKLIRSPVKLYIRGAGIGVFKHISVKSVQMPPLVKSSIPHYAKHKSPYLCPDALNTAILL